MSTEEKKLKYLADHGWKPITYLARNRTDIVWQLQLSNRSDKLESTLNMLEISRLSNSSLVRHCEYIERRMNSDLKRTGRRELKEAR